MIQIGGILSALGGLGSLVCAILILIQLFKKEGVGLGILGIFCGIYTYIWGWIKSKELGLKNIMLGWTACIVMAMIGYGISIAGVVNNPEFRKKIEEGQRQESQSDERQ